MAMRLPPWGVAAICLLGHSASALLLGVPATDEAATWDNWGDVTQEDAGSDSGALFDDPPAGDAGAVPEDAGGVLSDPLPGDDSAWRRDDFAIQPASVSDTSDDSTVERSTPKFPAPRVPARGPYDYPPAPGPVDALPGDETPGGGMCQNCNGVQFTDEEKHFMMEGTDYTKNLCIYGHLVPELFVIGSISGGTTSFCSALEHSPAMDWPINPGKNFDRRVKPTRWKEGHYFDKWFTNGIDLLINDYHECDSQVRKVAVEGSARYALDRRVPGRIVQWYGIKLASKIKFIHILRDPVARFHSHYWKAIDKIWCVSLSLYSILKVTQMAMGGDPSMFEDGGAFGGCGDLLEAGYYTSQISYWWEFYPSQQFIYIPFKLALQIDKSADPNYPKPHEFIWKMMGIRGKEPKLTYENSNQHAKLEEDLDPQQIRAFRTHLYLKNSPHLIAAMVAPSNATLYGFTGERTVPAVAVWLAQHW